jgi:hypothetical protein
MKTLYYYKHRVQALCALVRKSSRYTSPFRKITMRERTNLRFLMFVNPPRHWSVFARAIPTRLGL